MIAKNKLIELDKEVANFRQWITKALNIGENLLSKESEDLASAMDERQRILNRTSAIIHKITALQNELQSQQGLSPAQQAQIKEKRALISDLGPKILEQEKRLLKKMRKQTHSINSELASNVRNTKVIKQYLTQPRI
ncbi:MAG: hypothetical protein GX801_00200 [Fibrobacter sp.]|nr:hypothetical protein [Fibrobacter sp.]